MSEFVEVNLLRPIPEVVTAAGEFPVGSDAAARLLVRLCVGVSARGGEGGPFKLGSDPIRFANPDPAVRRGADRAMHELLQYDDSTALVKAGEVRRALRTVLERAGVRDLYPVGGDDDRLDLERYGLFVDLVAVGNAAALAASDAVEVGSMTGAHQALVEAYSLDEGGLTRGAVVWPHLEVVERAIVDVERRLLSALLAAADGGTGPEVSAAVRRAGRRLLALGVDEADEDALGAYLASAVDRGDLQARWRQIEEAFPSVPVRLRDVKERQGAQHDPGRFGAAAFTTRRVCRVGEATPWELGVEKAAVEAADAAGVLPFVSPGGPQQRLEDALADALAADGLTVIVLRGASGTGKSRMAYEAARSVAPGAWVVAPRDAEFAAAVCDPGEHAVLRTHPGEPVILWLDDVELHVGAEVEGTVRPGLTLAHLERLREAGPDRPVVVLATAGGKGYRTHKEAGERVDLRRLGFEIDRFIKRADVLIPISGAVERGSAVAVLGEDAAEEIAETGIGSYALRTEILGALYQTGDWPLHLEAPAGERREGLALADSLLAWRVAVTDEAVEPDLARSLWARFRGRRDLQSPADDGAWKSAVGWATAPPVPHQPLVRTRPDGLFDVNDNLRAVADIAFLAEHLLRQEDLLETVALKPFEIGLRLHLPAPDAALACYRRAMEMGDARAANNIGALICDERPEDAEVYFRRAIEAGDPRGHFNLAKMLEAEHPDRARKELRKAVSGGFLEAFALLAKLIEDDPEEAILLLREGARRGDPDAMVEYAHRTFDQDEEEAKYLLETAMERGSSKAALRLGIAHAEEDLKDALELFERAGRMGEPVGYLAAASYLANLEGEETEERRSARIDLCQAAGDAGLVDGMFNAAVLLHDLDPDLADSYYERAVAAGSAAAMNNLGHRLRKRDPRRAEELFRRAIELGGEEELSAIQNLADLLLEDRRDESIALYRRAAAMGGDRAMFNLAGILVDEQREEAIGLLEGAVELGHTDAMVHLGFLLLDGDLDRGLALMRQAAELGNDNAQNNLGTMLEDEDPVEAERWYRKSIEGGNLRAKANLGRLLSKTDSRQAIRLWEEAAGEGDSLAAELLVERVVNLDEEGALDEVPDATLMSISAVDALDAGDREKARRLMESAARLGNFNAMVNLAMLEADQDPEWAIELLRTAAEAGYARGMLHLGRWLAETEPTEAKKLFREAAARSEPGALVELGRLIAQRDPDEALPIFREAAADGDPEAMFDLAALLFDSDRPTAIEWLRQAAAAGVPAAMHNLGVLLFEEKNREGLEFFEKASEAGYVSSSMNMGLLLKKIDPEKALIYFRRAADAGSEAGRDYVAEIERGLSSADGPEVEQ